VVVRFDGGVLTSDGRASRVREVERSIDLLARPAQGLDECRNPLLATQGGRIQARE
jgi:hypothetical protein